MAINQKAAQEGEITVTRITAKERRRINKKIKRRHQQLRNKYCQIHGKVVDWISHSFEEGSLYVSIRFKDKTEFSLQFSPQIVTDSIDLSDIHTSNSKIIREYYRGKEPY